MIAMTMMKSKVAIYFILIFMVGCSANTLVHSENKTPDKNTDPMVYGRNYNLSKYSVPKTNNQNGVQDSSLSYLSSNTTNETVEKEQRGVVSTNTVSALFITAILILFICVLSRIHIVYAYIKRKVNNR